MTGMNGVRFRSIEREGSKGEWGSSWVATKGSAPLERRDMKAEREAYLRRQIASPKSWSQFFVSTLFGDPEPQHDKEKTYHDGDDLDSLADASVEADDERNSVIDESQRMSKSLEKLGDAGDLAEYDGILPDLAGGVGIGVDFIGGEDGWKEVKLETVECEVPVKVFPGNTAFKAVDVIFDV